MLLGQTLDVLRGYLDQSEKFSPSLWVYYDYLPTALVFQEPTNKPYLIMDSTSHLKILKEFKISWMLTAGT